MSWQEFHAPAIPGVVQGTRAFKKGTRAFKKGSLSVLVSREPGPSAGEYRWHLSIAHPTRWPRWDEIYDARYSLLPGHITVAQLLPPLGEYVNIHRNCFHLWEISP